MDNRQLVRLTGISLALVSGGFLLYNNLSAGKPYRVPELSVEAPSLGQAAAPAVTLVADLRCPHCAAFDSVKGKTLEVRARAGEINLAYLLVARQEGADVAGNAALCAFEQNPDAFWAYKSAVYKLAELSQDTLLETANDLEIGGRTFKRCIRQNEHASTLELNEELAKELGIQGTPTLIVGFSAYPNPSTAIVVEVAGE